jgi:Uma2 family endonuclease
MRTTSGRKLLTAAEFEALARDGILAEGAGVELIEGEVVTMSPIGPLHSALSARLMYMLIGRLGARAHVRAANPVLLSDITEPQPDLAIVPHRDDYYRTAHPKPADILCLIEVSDTSLAFDRGRKARLYAAAGVPEYWILNLRDDVLEVRRDPRPEGYGAVRLLRRGERVACAAFPDLSLEVAEILG